MLLTFLLGPSEIMTNENGHISLCCSGSMFRNINIATSITDQIKTSY